MSHLLIIDALNLIRRIHAVQASQSLTPDQALIATRATLLNTTRKLLTRAAPTHAIAVFDAEVDGWRKARFPAYKEGRTPMPPELRAGLDSLQDAFWELGIDALLSETDEADDLIATLARKMARHGQCVTIVSTDKGFCQLLCPEIRIRDYFNKRWLDLPFVQSQFGVAPGRLVDYWALTGVGGSGIKGVPGIGPKSATALLQDHDSLAALLAAESDDKGVKKVQAHADEARLAFELVRLRDDIELGFNLKDLRLPSPD
ncbi:protein Xni [Aeromonas schubertii]|uniref:flap endonuclease Xni n=1 Tax=Aeromonas schubertii TaxID=652 RepID=UPI00067E8548|nr:flap endonuclease Xni [Aeromonas schubertii]KUE80106.1 protein Xni [Aeromonas schubertii]